MYNRKTLLSIYNSISEKEIEINEFVAILPKLYLIMNKIKMDEIEITDIIDVLEEIKKLGYLNQIKPEIVDLIIKITRIDNTNLEGTLYFPMMLKHVLIPYNLNVCDKDYNLMIFLSEFEIFIELVSKMLNKKELMILDKYNHELKQITINYRDMQKIYKKYVINDVILDQMISHFASMMYFNLEDFDYDYDILIEILERIILNYQAFIDYCCSLGIHKNFTRLNQDMDNIAMEYVVSYEMLKFFYKHKKEEKIKRK